MYCVGIPQNKELSDHIAQNMCYFIPRLFYEKLNVRTENSTMQVHNILELKLGRNLNT